MLPARWAENLIFCAFRILDMKIEFTDGPTYLSELRCDGAEIAAAVNTPANSDSRFGLPASGAIAGDGASNRHDVELRKAEVRDAGGNEALRSTGQEDSPIIASESGTHHDCASGIRICSLLYGCFVHASNIAHCASPSLR